MTIRIVAIGGTVNPDSSTEQALHFAAAAAARITARDRRMGQKLSMGLTPKQVARLEGMASTEVETLVAGPEFKALIDGYNTLHAMPEEEQRRIAAKLGVELPDA